MAGSVKDTVMAAMKIPNQNFIIPSKYDIVRRQQGDNILGAINPLIYSSGTQRVAPDNSGSDVSEINETAFNKVL